MGSRVVVTSEVYWDHALAKAILKEDKYVIVISFTASYHNSPQKNTILKQGRIQEFEKGGGGGGGGGGLARVTAPRVRGFGGLGGPQIRWLSGALFTDSLLILPQFNVKF